MGISPNWDSTGAFSPGEDRATAASTGVGLPLTPGMVDTGRGVLTKDLPWTSSFVDEGRFISTAGFP